MTKCIFTGYSLSWGFIARALSSAVSSRIAILLRSDIEYSSTADQTNWHQLCVAFVDRSCLIKARSELKLTPLTDLLQQSE